MTANLYWIELKEKFPFSSKITCRANVDILKNYSFSFNKGVTTVFFLSKEVISTDGYGFLKVDGIVFLRNKGLLFSSLDSDTGSIHFGKWIGIGRFTQIIEQRQISFNEKVCLVKNFSIYSLLSMSKSRVECDQIDENIHFLLGCLTYCWTTNRNDRLHSA